MKLIQVSERDQVIQHINDLIDEEKVRCGCESVALDLVELLALRMPSRTSFQVAVLGFFVRANLWSWETGKSSRRALVGRLADAALAAPIGHHAMTKVFSIGVQPRPQ